MKENKVQIESWAPFVEGKNNLFQNDIDNLAVSRLYPSYSEISF